MIGATAAGWQGAVTAAQAGINVGLVDLPVHEHSRGLDLRQLPCELLREACADWQLRRPPGRRSVIGHAGREHWRQFSQHVSQVWQLHQHRQRDLLQSAGGSLWMGTPGLMADQSVHLHAARGQVLRIRADQVLLASGTRPQRPRLAPVGLAAVQEAAWLLNADVVPRDACIVGASMTGLRAACLLAWWGSRVTVVDGASGQFDSPTGQRAAWRQWADELDVQFAWGEDAIGFDGAGRRGTAVTLESGQRLTEQSVWLATARRGATDQLQLDQAGVGLDENGRVWCDDQHRTWAQSVSAVGDVVGFTPSRLTDTEVISNLVQARRPMSGCGWQPINNAQFVPERYRPDPAHTGVHSAAASRTPAHSRRLAAAAHSTRRAGW